MKRTTSALSIKSNENKKIRVNLLFDEPLILQNAVETKQDDITTNMMIEELVKLNTFTGTLINQTVDSYRVQELLSTLNAKIQSLLSDFFEPIPNEVFLMIFSYVPTSTLNLVSKRWLGISQYISDCDIKKGKELLSNNEHEEAIKSFDKASKRGSLAALEGIVECYLQRGQKEDALRLLSKLSNYIPGFACKLGEIYFSEYQSLSSSPTTKQESLFKLKQAVDLWTEGSGKDHAKSHFMFALVHFNREITDLKEFEDVENRELDEVAAKYFIKSLEGGENQSLSKLGYCYYVGRGFKKNKSKAAEYYNLALSKNVYNGSVLINLGNCYYNGEGVEQNSEKAVELWNRADEIGYLEKTESNAGLRLAKIYYDGEGVDKDYEKAFKLWSKLSNHKQWKIRAEAKYHLGRCYYRGEGVKEDYDEAFKLWTENSNSENFWSDIGEKSFSGHPESQFSLGVYYFRHLREYTQNKESSTKNQQILSRKRKVSFPSEPKNKQIKTKSDSDFSIAGEEISKKLQEACQLVVSICEQLHTSKQLIDIGKYPLPQEINLTSVQISPIQFVPQDLLVYILSYLDFNKDIANSRLVCKRWNSANQMIGANLTKHYELFLSDLLKKNALEGKKTIYVNFEHLTLKVAEPKTEIEKLAREYYSVQKVKLESLLNKAILRGSGRANFLAATLHLESLKSYTLFWDQGKKYSTVEGLVYRAHLDCVIPPDSVSNLYINSISESSKDHLSKALKLDKTLTIEILKRDTEYSNRAIFILAWYYKEIEKNEEAYVQVMEPYLISFQKIGNKLVNFDLGVFYQSLKRFQDASIYYQKYFDIWDNSSWTERSKVLSKESVISAIIELAKIYGYGLGEGEQKVSINIEKAKSLLSSPEVRVGWRGEKITRIKKAGELYRSLLQFWGTKKMI